MTLGEKLQALRRSRGLSQEQLALELNVSRQAVSKWELGESTPDLDKLRALCAFFGVTSDYLIWEGQAAPTPAAPSGARTDYGARKARIRAFVRQNGSWAGYAVSILGAALLLRALLSMAAVYLVVESSNAAAREALEGFGLGELMPTPFYSASLTASVPYLLVYAAMIVGGLVFSRWYKKRRQEGEGTPHDDV